MGADSASSLDASDDSSVESSESEESEDEDESREDEDDEDEEDGDDAPDEDAVELTESRRARFDGRTAAISGALPFGNGRFEESTAGGLPELDRCGVEAGGGEAGRAICAADLAATGAFVDA